MPCISNGKILKCSLQKSFQSSSRSPLWSVRRRLQSKCSSGVSSPHTAADHLDLVLSPEYDEPRSLQVGAEMKIKALQEKTTGDGWLGMRCPCSWFCRIILHYISALCLLPS